MYICPSIYEHILFDENYSLDENLYMKNEISMNFNVRNSDWFSTSRKVTHYFSHRV